MLLGQVYKWDCTLPQEISNLTPQTILYITDQSLSTCEGRASTGGHETVDAQQFVVNWGMTYLKYCMCNSTHEWRLEAYEVFYNAVVCSIKIVKKTWNN